MADTDNLDKRLAAQNLSALADYFEYWRTWASGVTTTDGTHIICVPQCISWPWLGSHPEKGSGSLNGGSSETGHFAMPKWRATVIAVALIASAGSSLAQEFPNMDFDCPAGDHWKECLAGEFSAKVTIVEHWSQIPRDVRAGCSALVQYKKLKWTDMAECIKNNGPPGKRGNFTYWGKFGGLPVANMQECFRLQTELGEGVCTNR